MGDDFSLGDLMKLGLHQYADACNEIVDRAGKELTIENSLGRLEDTWASLNLAFAPYQVEHLSTERVLMPLDGCKVGSTVHARDTAPLPTASSSAQSAVWHQA